MSVNSILSVFRLIIALLERRYSKLSAKIEQHNQVIQNSLNEITNHSNERVAAEKAIGKLKELF